MARETRVGRLAMAISILFAAGTLAACGDEGTTDGGGTTGGSTTGGATTGGSSGGTTTGGTAGFLTVNGCTSSDYVDMTGSGTAMVAFPGNTSGQYHYVPNCVRINAGQSVTFNGTLSSHPINPGVAPSLHTSDPSSPSNPITRTATGSSVTFAFPTAGTYGMYCEFHQGLGMYGAIQVQ